MKRLHAWGFTAILCVLTLIPSTDATAADLTLMDRSIHESRDSRLDAMVSTNVFIGIFRAGVGAWYSIPVVPDGFIKPWNDGFFVEFGGMLDYWRDSTDFVAGNCTQSWWRATPMGGVRWDFYLTDEWTVFGKGKAGYSIGFNDSYDCNGFEGSNSDRIDSSAVAFDFGGGAYWHFDEGMSLRMESGVHSLFAIGLSIEM